MAEQNQTIQPSTTEGMRSARNTRENPAGATHAEQRSFASGDGSQLGDGVDAARNLAQKAANVTREVGQSSRQGGKDVAASWRSASEPFVSMQMDMHRWFEDLWRQATGFGLAPMLRTAHPFAVPSAAPIFGMPPTDLKETPEAYVLCAEAPGLSAGDLDLQIKGDMLVLCGHKAEAREDARAEYRISERRFGRFERSFPLPPQIDRGNIGAEFRDGLLTVTLPKTAEAAAGANRIPILG